MSKSPAPPNPNSDSQGPTPPTPQAEWELALSQLRATNAELQRRKADAEKDRELFRTLYGTASAHASATASENAALLERAERAEGQARDGLAMVRATYDVRMRRAEEEAARWRAQYEVLVARERRAAEVQEELRARAGREPELRAEVERLRGRLEALEEDYARMEGLVEVLTNAQAEETEEIAETAQASVTSAAVVVDPI
ncbi:hypothetical protein BC628DRAFT_1416580 [Trametes gibbosa]|nr:hypothetical protein BC628DRAFT_1416580 [Trametes gibbosa]